MKLLYSYTTKVGTFFIGKTPDGRYHPVYDNEKLGSYESIEQAIDDLTQNATSSVFHPITSKVIDTSTLDISDDISEWKRLV